MGDMAEGLLNGDFDSITGEYLGEGDGFPRTLYNNSKRPKDAVSYYNGISNYINKHHSDLIKYNKNSHKELKDTHTIIRAFLRHKNIEHDVSGKYGNIWKNAKKAQEYFNEFKEFLKTYPKN